MVKKRNKKPAPYLHNVYEDKQSTGALSMYKQGGFATDYVIETKNFGLSTIAKKYLNTILGSFTLSNFPPLSPEAPAVAKLNKEETFGELSRYIPHVPQTEFQSKNDIIRLMKQAHHEEGEISGRDKQDFEEAMQELQEKVKRTFSISKNGSSGKKIKETVTTDTPLLNFNTIQYTKEIEESSGAQQLLFERTVYVLSITHPILLMGIEEKNSSVGMNYSLLPIDSGALLESTEERHSLEKRERALLDYVAQFYDRKIAPFSWQKSKRRKVFTEEELIVGVMGIKKETYLGKNRNRAIKELTQALEKLKGTRFVEKTEHLKDTKEVVIYWNLKA